MKPVYVDMAVEALGAYWRSHSNGEEIPPPVGTLRVVWINNTVRYAVIELPTSSLPTTETEDPR